MNKGLKYLMVGIVAAGVALSSYAGTIGASAVAQANTYLALSTGAYTPAGWLVEIGSFVGPTTDGVLPDLSSANWKVFASGTTGGGGGDLSVVGSGDDTSPYSFKTKQLYLVAYNNAVAGSATEWLVSYVAFGSNPGWRFPTTTDIPNTTAVELQDLLALPDGVSTALAPGAHLVFGSSAVTGDTYNQIRMAAIPEPSTVLLVGLGLLGLVGLRRRS